MSVDLSPLRNAVGRLEEALDEHNANPASTVIRDGLIQRFEFTYDLAPKMLRRVLAIGADTPADIDTMTFPALMRTAFEQNVVDKTWPKWLDHRANRNITSHTYNEDKANEVAMSIPMFLTDARALLRALELRAGS